MAYDQFHRTTPDFDGFDSSEAQQGGVPGKKPVTAGLHARPQTNIIFRVENAEAAHALAGAFGARDSNGVASGADVAVDRAQSSSGSALPEDLRGRFESSLGADLSSVRIHTGGESAEAAGAVGAKAYTTGNDIHFGAGQYDPSSAFGVHLIAHEVAHTVQQAGSTPTRQNKLEVSTPQDSLEADADRAADAMVAGRSASPLSQGTSALSRRESDAPKDRADPMAPSVTVTGDDNYQAVQGGGASAARDEAKVLCEENKNNPGTTTYLGGSNSNDRSQASALLKQVEDGINELMNAQAEDPYSETAKMMSANHAAKAQLDRYLGASEAQNAMQKQFKPQLDKADVQYTRLEGMYAQACTNLGIEAKAGALGADHANALATAGTKATYATDVAKDVQKQSVSSNAGDVAGQKLADSKITQVKSSLTVLARDLARIPKQIGTQMSEIKAANATISAATAKTKLPAPVNQPNDAQKKLQGDVAKVKKEFDSAVTVMNAAVSLAGSGLQLIEAGGGKGGMGQSKGGDEIEGSRIDLDAGTKGGDLPHREKSHTDGGFDESAKMQGADSPASLIKDAQANAETGKSIGSLMAGTGGEGDAKFSFVEGLADAMLEYTTKVNSANALIGAIDDAATKASMEATAQTLVAAKTVLEAKLKELRRLRNEHDLTKATMRAQADQLMKLIDGNRTPGKKGPDFGVILAFQTEATIFISDCDAAIEVGKVERETAREVNPNVKADGVRMSEGSNNITNSASHGRPYWSAVKNKDLKIWSYSQHKVFITEQGNGTQGQLDAGMDQRMTELIEMKGNAKKFQAAIGNASGISMATAT